MTFNIYWNHNLYKASITLYLLMKESFLLMACIMTKNIKDWAILI